MRNIVAQLLLMVLAFGSTLALRVYVVDPAMDARRGQALATEALQSPGPEILSLVSAEHRLAWADLFWLGIVQEFGKPIEGRTPSYDRLERWAQIATDLDVRYFIVYQGSAINLMVYGKRYRSADTLLEKGRFNLPERWEIPFLLGYSAYFHHGLASRAADYWLEASQLPGAPRFLPALAGRARWQSGDTQGAIAMLESMAEYLSGPHREDVEIRLKLLKSDPILREYDAACLRFRGEHGRRPQDGAEVHAEGYVESPPFDLLDGAITFDESCRARTEYTTVREDEVLERIGSEARQGSSAPDDLVRIAE